MKRRIAMIFALLVLALTMSFSVNAQTQSTTPATKPTIYVYFDVQDGDTLGAQFAQDTTTLLGTEFTVITLGGDSQIPAAGSELMLVKLTPVPSASGPSTADGISLTVLETTDGSVPPALLGMASDILTSELASQESQAVLGFADGGYQQLVAQNQK